MKLEIIKKVHTLTFVYLQVPCARCQATSRPAIFMLPAKVTCPRGWTKEYSGYLMANSPYFDMAASTFECIDANPEFIRVPDHLSDNGARLWFVSAECDHHGTIGKCPPYRHGRQITCVVCSQ